MIVASAKSRARIGPAEGWSTLGWIGLVFSITGGLDFALTWFPPNFGNREWVFATVTQSFNGLPILLMGVGLLAIAADELERRWWGRLGVAGAAVVLAWVLAGFVLWALQVPLALQTVPDELALGLQEAVAKTLVQSLVYSAILVYLVRKSWRAARRAHSPS